jgi:citrate synthase
VLEQLRDIGGVENVTRWLDARLATKSKVMGFGHRVYKVKDPRAIVLQGLARELFELQGSTPIYHTALELERQMEARVGAKGIYPNVDFFSGIVYSKLGIAPDLFTPVFGLARVAGYLAHWREQMQANKLFRPAQVYVGEPERPFVPLEQRE